jgi:hypothetical protein
VATSLLEYNFSLIYKPRKFYFVVDALFQMPDLIKESGVPNQTDAMFFLLQLVWLCEMFKYLIIKKSLVHYN